MLQLEPVQVCSPEPHTPKVPIKLQAKQKVANPNKIFLETTGMLFIPGNLLLSAGMIQYSRIQFIILYWV